MKYILKINDVTETVNCSVGKNTFSFPQPLAIKKAKAALRKQRAVQLKQQIAQQKEETRKCQGYQIKLSRRLDTCNKEIATCKQKN